MRSKAHFRSSLILPWVQIFAEDFKRDQERLLSFVRFKTKPTQPAKAWALPLTFKI
jgi:hypothetical protein